MECTNLTEYMDRYGQLLGQQAERSLRPLHVPGRDALVKVPLLRQPFEAQLHVISAATKQLRRDNAVVIAAQLGTGKTILSMATVHSHAAGKPYRAIVMAPGTLLNKWLREIETTIPNANVVTLRSWKDVVSLDRTAAKEGAQWYIIGRDRAKLGSGWKSAVRKKTYLKDGGFLCCPSCGGKLCNKDGIAFNDKQKRKLKCEYVYARNADGVMDKEKGCGQALWQMHRKLNRFEPARYIKRKLRGFFDYFILDEAHEARNSETAVGHAAGTLAAAAKKVIALTGTIIGGLSEHLRPLLFRLAPSSLVREGLKWNDAMPFNERYGRIETRIIERGGCRNDDAYEDHKQSRGSSKRTKTRNVIPGVVPALFGKHLLDKTIFLSLDEVADNLPPMDEDAIAVEMDQELQESYSVVEDAIREKVREMMIASQGSDKRLLGKMVTALMTYPDYPFDWKQVGYWDMGGDGESGSGSWVPVVDPPSLNRSVICPKEQATINLCLAEKKEGRKIWVYVQWTDTHDVQSRLAGLLEQAGLKVKVLRSSVEPEKREAWIAKHAPGADVIVSHPQLVQTGLDFFDKAGTYNIPTILFHEVGFFPFVTRQAAARAWRIGQTLPCRVRYLYYSGTMQARAIGLMSEKLQASQALEGKFSTEGLAALAGQDGGSMEMELARSLASRLQGGGARRVWRKIDGGDGYAARMPEPAEVIATPAKALEVLAQTDWIVHGGGCNNAAGGQGGKLTKCRVAGAVCYVRENLAINHFGMSSNQRLSLKRGKPSKSIPQILELLAPDDHWEAIAAVVKAEDGLRRNVRKNRRFTWKWAERQFQSGQESGHEVRKPEPQELWNADGTPIPPEPAQTLTGVEFCRMMRAAKTTIKKIAEFLDVTQASIKRARKDGTSDVAWVNWLRLSVPMVAVKVPRKRTAKVAARKAAG
jgi:hypothetical protein